MKESPVRQDVSGSSLHIRVVELADLPAVHRMDQAAFGAAIAYNFTSIRQMYDSCRGCFFVGESDGQIVGYSLGCKTFGSDSGWLLDAVVLPEKQGMGLGQRLSLRAMESLAREGVKVVRLVVQPGNHRAVRLYERLGFSEESREPNYFGSGEQMVMVSRLSD
jgi:ribosomal-protein-alanine N-acetyltransferase